MFHEIVLRCSSSSISVGITRLIIFKHGQRIHPPVFIVLVVGCSIRRCSCLWKRTLSRRLTEREIIIIVIVIIIIVLHQEKVIHGGGGSSNAVRIRGARRSVDDGG